MKYFQKFSPECPFKPRFFRKQTDNLITATQPWQRISLDFKGPVKGKK